MEKLIEKLSESLGPAGLVLMMVMMGMGAAMKLLWSRLTAVQDSKDTLTHSVVEALNNASNSMDNLRDEVRAK